MRRRSSKNKFRASVAWITGQSFARQSPSPLAGYRSERGFRSITVLECVYQSNYMILNIEHTLGHEGTNRKRTALTLYYIAKNTNNNNAILKGWHIVQHFTCLLYNEKLHSNQLPVEHHHAILCACSTTLFVALSSAFVSFPLDFHYSPAFPPPQCIFHISPGFSSWWIEVSLRSAVEIKRKPINSVTNSVSVSYWDVANNCWWCV